MNDSRFRVKVRNDEKYDIKNYKNYLFLVQFKLYRDIMTTVFGKDLKFRSKTGATSVFMRGCAVLSVWRNACHFTFQIVFF